MKNLLFLDSRLILDFWIETMNTMNCLQNKLLIKNQREKFISKVTQIRKKQDVSYLKQVESLANVKIFKKKQDKSNIQKNW